MIPHDKNRDNPSELICDKDVAASGLWLLLSFDEPRDKPAVAAPQVPAVAEPTLAPPAMEEVELETARPPTLEEVEVIHRDAYNEGFATGERSSFYTSQLEARQEVEGALKERLQNLEHLMTRFLEPIAEQDTLIEQGMVNLVNHVARQVIQRGLYMDPGHVRQVLHKALKLLPMGTVNIRVHINPQDFKWVKTLRERHGESWRIFEDDSLLPGGYYIETECSRIGATIGTRLTQAVKQLFGQQHEQMTHPLASGIQIDLDAPRDVDAP